MMYDGQICTRQECEYSIPLRTNILLKIYVEEEIVDSEPTRE